MKRYLYLLEAAVNENDVTFSAGDLMETESAEITAELKRNNKAIEIDGSLQNEYEVKLNTAFDKFAKDIKRIKDSNDPIYDVVGKRNFELAKLEDERKKALRNIMLEYEFKIKDVLAEAEESQAKAVTQFTNSDVDFTEKVVQIFETRSYTNYPYAKEQLLNSLESMSIEQLAAIQTQLPKVFAVVDGKEEHPAVVRSIILNKIEKGLPIDLVSAIKQMPLAEELSTKIIVDTALERRSISETGHTETNLVRPSMREVAAKYDKDNLPSEFQA